jgi:hypothetical protein
MCAGGRAFARGWTIVFFSLMLAGCGPLLPGFWAHSWLYKVPVSQVAKTVRCEVSAFLIEERKRQSKPDNWKRRLTLDATEGATIALTLQEEHGGGVTYIGIDLNRLGLSSLADLIAAQNKAPNLQAGLQGKGQISSKIEFKIPQVPGPQAELEQECRPLETLPLPLSLDTWLDRFFDSLQQDRPEKIATECMTKITLRTQFQVVVSVKGGSNPLFGTAFILPISGLNFEYNPTFTHTLEIGFFPTLNALNKANSGWCQKEKVAKVTVAPRAPR